MNDFSLILGMHYLEIAIDVLWYAYSFVHGCNNFGLVSDRFVLVVLVAESIPILVEV